MKAGHEVTLLEAAARVGGHIQTLHEPLPDGLYADAGAEHFYRPGYDQLWKYLDEFQLPLISYPRRRNLLRNIRGSLYTPEMLADRRVLARLGYNQREVDHMARTSYSALVALYHEPYVERFRNEDDPFGSGLGHLDRMTATEFIRDQKASPAAIGSLGGQRSALQALWHSSIRRSRGMAWYETNLFRVRGGNQQITDAFAKRLGRRIRTSSPVTAIRHGASGVDVEYQMGGGRRTEGADFLVTCMSLALLRRIKVEPGWSQAKRYVIENMGHDSHMRVIFTSRSRFWKKDAVSPNIQAGESGLGMVWSMADEVPTERGILIGTAAATRPDLALTAFRRRYPGRSEDISDSRIVDWTRDPWATTCLPLPYPPGELARYWPEVIRPAGRILFAGVYADNMPFGLEAAVRSAKRAASHIDTA